MYLDTCDGVAQELVSADLISGQARVVGKKSIYDNNFDSGCKFTETYQVGSGQEKGGFCLGNLKCDFGN